MSPKTEAARGWVVMRLRYDCKVWYPLVHTVSDTRRGAIAKVDAICGAGYYRRERRGRRMRAVQCEVRPIWWDVWRLEQ